MKKILKISLIVLIIIFIVSSLFLIFQKNIEKKLREKEISVSQKWDTVYSDIDSRYNILSDLCQREKIIINSEQLLCHIVFENKEKIQKLEKKSSIEFVKLEYDLNQVYTSFIKQYDDSVSKGSVANLLVENIKLLDLNTNKNIKIYNDAVLNFNEFYSTFPNFIIAKRKGFSRKNYFSIKYGIENKDPIEKEKKLLEQLKEKDKEIDL